MGIGTMNNDDTTASYNKYEEEINRLLTIVVVGGGPTGVELSAELADFKANDVKRLFGEEIANRLKIVLVEAIPRILGPFDKSLADVAQKHLIDHGVDVRCCLAVTKIKDDRSVTLAPSTPRSATPEQKAAALAKAHDMPVGALVWAAGIGPRPVVQVRIFFRNGIFALFGIVLSRVQFTNSSISRRRASFFRFPCRNLSNHWDRPTEEA